MAISTETKQALIDAIEAAGYIPEGYSGRGMNDDEECLSFVTDDETNILGAVAMIVAEAEYEQRLEVARLFQTCRRDSLGRDKVIYFPRIQFEET